MGKSFSNNDHDPGDEDPTERVKRALVELIDDGLPDESAAAIRERFGLGECYPPSHPTTLGDVWVGETRPTWPWWL